MPDECDRCGDRSRSEEGGAIMDLQTIADADNKPNSFWRAVVLSDNAPAPMGETIELSIDSKLELVWTVESVANSASAKLGFDEDDAGWIELAVREAVVNAIKKYNYENQNERQGWATNGTVRIGG